MPMLDTRIKSYTRRFMSDAKWRKLFYAAGSNSEFRGPCVWKLVSDKEPTNGYLPSVDELGDTYVGDCGALNGPFKYQEIEWLFLPRRHDRRAYEGASVSSRYVDIESILECIQAVGHFEAELTEQGLTIYGYKP